MYQSTWRTLILLDLTELDWSDGSGNYIDPLSYYYLSFNVMVEVSSVYRSIKWFIEKIEVSSSSVYVVMYFFLLLFWPDLRIFGHSFEIVLDFLGR